MALTIQMLLGALAAAAVLLLLRLLRGAMLTPVCAGKNQELSIHLRVSGPSPELEATVDGLLWLLSEGVLRGRVVLHDNGMDQETREVARRLALDHGKVELWTREKSLS